MDQFYVFFSLLLLASTFMTITSYNPIHSIFWLVIVFITSAMLIMSINYEFIGLILIIIYVGAIAILFLFVIMMLDIFQLSKLNNFGNILPISFFFIVQALFYWNNINQFTCFTEHWNFMKENHLFVINNIIYTNFGLWFIIVSLVLLVGMIGAIVLVLPEKLISHKQNLTIQHQRNNSWI